MPDNEIIFKIGLEADGVDSGVKKAESAVTSSMKNIKTSVEDAGKSLEGLGKLSSVFGEGGRQISEFGESVAKAMSSIGSGLGSLGELETALPAITGGVVGLTVAFAALAIATSSIGSHLEDLKQSLRATEGDFARLEIAARETSLGVEGMGQVFAATRSGIRSAALELRNYAEMLQVMEDREKNAAANAALRRREHELSHMAARGIDVSRQQERLAKEREQLEERQASVADERQRARMDRARREFEATASAAAKISLGLTDIKGMEPDKILAVADALDKLKARPATEQMEEFLKKIEEAGSKSPAAAAKLQAALNDMYGPHAARLVQQYAEQIKQTGHLTDEEAERISVAMGNLSKEQRKALDDMAQALSRAAIAGEAFAAKMGAVIAAAGGAKDVMAGLAHFFKDVADGIQASIIQLDTLSILLPMVKLGWEGVVLAATKAAAAFGLASQASVDAAQKSVDATKKEIDERVKHHQELEKGVEKSSSTSDVGSASESTAQDIRNLGNAALDATHALGGTPSQYGHPAGHASGGLLHGPGSETSDSIPVMASRGEYIVNAGSVRNYGVGMLNAINSNRFALGGLAGDIASASGLSSVAVNTVTNLSGSGALHPVTIHLPGFGSFGGFSASASAVANISKAAMVQRMTSAGRPASSYG